MGKRPPGLVPGSTIDLSPFITAGETSLTGRLLLFFERGHWCRECVRHLEELADAATDLREATERIVVITHESAADALASPVPFPAIPDPALELAAALDLVHLDEFGKRTIRPSTILLDHDGVVLFSYVGDDSRDRPTVAALLLGFESLQL